MSSLLTRPRNLHSGDRLTQPEFHRRYESWPEEWKAELVEGVVYVASPVSGQHSSPHAAIVLWLGTYQAKHPELRIDDNITVYLDADNEVQPDACLWHEVPGGPVLDEHGYVEGPPQLVAEVAVSSVSYDLHDKLNAYRRTGVREYVVWPVEDRAIDWFRLHDGAYLRVEPDERDVIESQTFPGLRLAVQKMLAGDRAGVLAELEQPTG
jgi:Uma2 family endonuclease